MSQLNLALCKVKSPYFHTEYVYAAPASASVAEEYMWDALRDVYIVP